jgi:FtsZ-interacting cell division protein ZipA
MELVQLILIIAGIVVVLAVLSALMSFGRRRGEKRVHDKRVHDKRRATDGDATAQDPNEDRRDP